MTLPCKCGGTAEDHPKLGPCQSNGAHTPAADDGTEITSACLCPGYVPAFGEAADGGCALMARIPHPHPGWNAVRNQATEVGMEATPDDELHVTLVFFGRNLQPRHCEAAWRATTLTIGWLTAQWRAFRESRREEVVPAFVPLLVPGTFRVNVTPKANYVVADVDPGRALMGFREKLVESYAYTIRNDFGGYRPHVTLAKGSADKQLLSQPLTSAGTLNARALTLKLGSERWDLEIP